MQGFITIDFKDRLWQALQPFKNPFLLTVLPGSGEIYMKSFTILLTVILMDLLAGMEFDLFVPAFPQIQNHFGLSIFWVESLLSVNFLGYCLSLFLVGSLADRYGRKPLLLMGLLIFVAGSVLCVGGSSFWHLLIGRFLQGAGVAAPAILSFLIIADSYPLEHQQRFLALLNGVMNISVALAPVLGSYITLHFNWHGNFVALLGLGLLVLFMTMWWIPDNQPEKKSHPPLVAGYLKLFTMGPLMLLIGHIVLMIVPYWIFVGLSPMLYMQSLGVSLQHFGYYQGVLALVFALGSLLFSWVLPQRNQKQWLTITTFLFFFSLGSLTLITWINTQSPLLITLGFLPFIIAQIIPATILYPICLHYLPEAKGQISALIQGGRLVLCAIGLQVASIFYQGSFRNIGIILIIVIVFVILTFVMLVKRLNHYVRS